MSERKVKYDDPPSEAWESLGKELRYAMEDWLCDVENGRWD